MLKENIIKKFNGSSMVPQSISGVDGTYVVESLLSIDVICAAAVGVEGLLPSGGGISYWNEPHHSVSIFCESHTKSLSAVAKAIMTVKEIEIASKAPHSVVLIDGSAFTPLASVASGISSAMENLEKNSSVFQYLVQEFKYFIKSYKEILSNDTDEKIYAFVPKYVTTNYLAQKFQIKIKVDDRSLATRILRPGEFFLIKQKNTGNVMDPETGEVFSMDEALSNVVTVYFRPTEELPAIKIDISKKIAHDKALLFLFFETITYQFSTPSIIEPYPLYLAHETVKYVRQGCLSAIDAASIQAADKLGRYDSDVFLNFYSYRTKEGSS